ncbi:AmmeMemoRadiSam system protein B [Aeromonas diversa]|uniref:AmmeMemoRadiSam system protein B n=1 Tax=Aeromonas diversa TaxID=502790 RepID=UPI0034622F8F
MSQIRAPAVAGYFYPAEKQALHSWLCTHLDPLPFSHVSPHALLLPHAGYPYSGALAAQGVATLARQGITRVVILAPAHRVPLRGVALPDRECQGFQTPLGVVPLAMEALTALARHEGFIWSEEAHRQEHAIEVLLPLLQHRLVQFALVPLVVGDCDAAWLAAHLAPLLDESTLLISSSDLSHFMTQAQARALDDKTLAQVLSLMPGVGPRQACGCFGLNALLLLAKARGWRAMLLGQRDSGQVTGESERVVGYGCVGFY